MLKKLIITLYLALFSATNCYALLDSPLVVGDSCDGGTVFCVSDTEEGVKDCNAKKGAKGKYGLVMANEDQTNHDEIAWSAEWSPTGARSVDNGFDNTRNIINTHPKPKNNTNNNAAWLCHEYQGGGYSDWYLPAIEELNKLYIYAKANNLIGEKCAGGVQCLSERCYWSSTESYNLSDFAWAQLFARGSREELFKVAPVGRVRAIRTFSPSKIRLSMFLKMQTAYNAAVKAEQKRSILERANTLAATAAMIPTLGEDLWSIDTYE